MVKLHKITKFNPNLQIFKEKKYHRAARINDLKACEIFPIKFVVAHSHSRIYSLPFRDWNIIKLVKTGKPLFIIIVRDIERRLVEYRTFANKIKSCYIIILYKDKFFRISYENWHKCMSSSPVYEDEIYEDEVKKYKSWSDIRDDINDEEFYVDFEFASEGSGCAAGRITFRDGFLVIGNSVSDNETVSEVDMYSIYCCDYIEIRKNKEFVDDFVNVMIDIEDSKKILDSLRK
jgi:hypothetical protein